MLKTKESLPFEDGTRETLRYNFLRREGLEKEPVTPLPVDASGRRYFRLSGALLMDAPPAHENTAQFDYIAQILKEVGLSVPHIYVADHTHGFLLLEDFGDLPYRQAIQQGVCEKLLYGEAVGALGWLHSCLSRIEEVVVPTYTLDLFLKNAGLFLEWTDFSFSEKAKDDFKDLWEEAYLNQPFLPQTLVLRDVMVDNLFWLPSRQGVKRCGFIDFQDATWGPITYDLVSLLEDARRDISPSFAADMVDIYLQNFPDLSRDDFFASYALWGAQRTTRILGVFSRLAKRDGKPHYLSHVPRLWTIIERDLQHPSLQGLRKWFEVYGGLK